MTQLCRKHGINSATVYAWKAKHGGIDVSQARKLEGAGNFRYFYWTEIAIQAAMVHQIDITGTLPGWRRAGLAALVVLVLGYDARFVTLL